MKRRIRIERLRLMSGGESKMALSMLPKKTRTAVNKLVKRHYFYKAGRVHNGTLYYDEQTDLSRMKPFSYYERRYGIRFVDAREHAAEPSEKSEKSEEEESDG